MLRVKVLFSGVETLCTMPDTKFRPADSPFLKAPKLTYIATGPILKRAIEEGALWHLQPALGEAQRRSLLVHSDINRLWGDSRSVRAIGAMRGYMEGFVKGGAITMGLTPHKHGPAIMGRLEPIPEGTWDFRCVDPKPATRVFGRFLCRDVFIALEWWPRSKPIPGIDKKPLGAPDSQEWHMALGSTHERWASIFPNIPPLIGSTVSDYINENAHSV